MREAIEINDVPIIFMEPTWQFGPSILNSDQKFLKEVFGPGAGQWLVKNIKEAVASLEADSATKVINRCSNGEHIKNHKTGQVVGILYWAAVRIKPYPTDIIFYLGSPEEVKRTFKLSKRTFQHESAKAHGARQDN